jgi:para-aminobenzoate synthetase component 1
MKEKIDGRIDPEKIFSLLHKEEGAIFLDSSLRDGKLGRYSVILSRPFATLTLQDGKTKYTRTGEATSDLPDFGHFSGNEDPLILIRMMLEYFSVPAGLTALPCENGCAAGFISYDFGEMLERLPDMAEESPAMPRIVLGLYDFAIVTDHSDDAMYLCSCPKDCGRSPGELSRQLDGIHGLIDSCRKEDRPLERTFDCDSPESNFTRKMYREMVQAAREYIRNGDIYQVNLSQRFRAGFSGDPYDMYSVLRLECPAPFSAYLSFGDMQVLSSSPERFFETDGHIVRTRPIKGTRPRGQNPAEDNRFRQELLSSPKDQAELVMIVDLLRNDLGKVCQIGSVEVETLFEEETYKNVFHLVSTIRGELAEGVDVTDLIRAVFPGGSITGAPKIRAMEIIEQLEPVKRGIYTGSIGYMGFDGRSDFNIVIRTLVCMHQELYYQVGGGIVWDSDPDAEYSETIDKGRSIQKTLMNFYRC